MTGRTAFVTGGAGGIGSAICRSLAASGHRVVVADLAEAPAAALAAEIGGVGVAMDVTDPASVAAAVEAAGPVDVCVNAAGWDILKPFLETDEDFTRLIIEINLGGCIRVSRALLPGMVERGWGRLINISSDAGRVGSSLEAVYSGAKGGVIAFTKTIAREMARHGITANTVCPGPTDTPLLRGVSPGPEGEKILTAMAKAVPMKRIGQPDDVAAAVAFFASEAAGYVTGQTLSVSGGLTMA